MTVALDTLKTFGTDETVLPARLVELGDLSFLVEPESVRGIRWRGIEVVRGISWPIRDENWVSMPQKGTGESLAVNSDTAELDQEFTVANGDLQCRLTLCADSRGSIEFQLTMNPQVDFRTNRSGFAVLHPVSGVAGTPLAVRHSDGSLEETEFPHLISPSQPAFDIVGIRHQVSGVDVDISFAGEIFEMEDQRNWSDASFKTYCHPLVFPFTYTLGAGESYVQSISISLSGGRAGSGTSARKALELTPVAAPFPDIGLALEKGWMCSPENAPLVAVAGPRFAQVRTETGEDPEFLAEAARFAQELEIEVDLEVVVPGNLDASESLRSVADAAAAAGLAPKRILPLPEGYLDSHQPIGPWPEGVKPAEAVVAAKGVFANSVVGGGILTNFTEFNRCPPDPEVCGFVSHGLTPLVHTADDRSVIETLESYPSIFASAEALGGGLPYRLGLVSIGMRSNPYGPAVADNPDQIRQCMAMHDPRHQGLFAAAWIVGALAQTEGHSVEAVSLGSPGGPFAIVSEPLEVLRPMFDKSESAQVYPIYHSFRAAAAMSGKARLAVSGLPHGVHGVATESQGGVELILANLSDGSAEVSLPFAQASAALLSCTSFDNAVADENWIESSRRQCGEQIELPPYGVGFIKAQR